MTQPGDNISSTIEELWNPALQEKSTKGKTRLKKSEIVYFPEFEAAAAEVSDPFWRDTLELCARRKFPRGFLYNGGLLKHKSSNLSINVTELEPQAAAGAITTFIRDHGRLYSPADELDSKNYEDPIIKEIINKYSDWKKIFKSSYRRSQYVWSFVFENFEDLSTELKEDLYTKINLGFELGYLVKEDVNFEFGRITSISGIAFTQNGVEYLREAPIKRRKAEIKAAGKDKKYCHYKSWSDYLDSLEKNYKIGAGQSSLKGQRVIPCSSGSGTENNSSNML